MDKEKEKIIEEAFKELDDELENIEKLKEEYGKKYLNASQEEREKMYLDELEQTYNLVVKDGMKVDFIKNEEK